MGGSYPAPAFSCPLFETQLGTPRIQGNCPNHLHDAHSTVRVASQSAAAVVVALEQRRLGHEELSLKLGSVRLKPTCCGVLWPRLQVGPPSGRALNGRNVASLTMPALSSTF